MTYHTFAIDQLVTAHALSTPKGPYLIVPVIAVGERHPTILGQERRG